MIRPYARRQWQSSYARRAAGGTVIDLGPRGSFGPIMRSFAWQCATSPCYGAPPPSENQTCDASWLVIG